MPAVSVIIPVFNVEKTIEKCVESLVLGRMRDLEVILVDDGSVDGSWELCQDLARRFSPVRCIRNGENRGVSHARNCGLDAATGDYVCFVDSDDWVSEYYVTSLMDTAQENPDALVLCGLHFINLAEDYRRVYLWEQAGSLYDLGKENFFQLHHRFLLPQLWNKIFRRDIIENHRLRFDESQSMGEDFQFVLDYMEAAKISRCVVVNRPLYFYTRTGNSSLMSTFGHTQRESEFARYARLRDLTGEPEQYEQAIRQLKGNYVYHCVRHCKESKARQLALIEEITADGRAKEHYRDLQMTRAKEAVVLNLRAARQRLAIIWGDFWRARNQRIVNEVRSILGDLQEPVTIISQNCIGGVVYKDLGLQFASPTVGLFIKSSDFVRFTSQLEQYFDRELQMHWAEEYPVGLLGDIEIHFMHYNTCREAKEAWLRRCGRINWRRIVVLCTDRDGYTEGAFARWQQIRYPKLLFTANQVFASHPDSVYYPEFEKQGTVGELIPRRRFYRNGALIKRIAGCEEREEK